VARLREGEGGPIMVNGSATLVRALYDAGLVDERRLMTWPVILGSGARLFPSDAPEKQKLTHVDTTTYANGIQLHVFRAAR
jgi:dihydrofolate reductase